MTIQDVISQFNTTPFIFAGSGITRRYYGLPDWKGLLSAFARRVKKDEFAYQSYEDRARYELDADDIMPLVASLIEKDFNEAWFDDVDGLRCDDENVYVAVSNGVSPFKAEISSYIGKRVTLVDGYEEEIEKLKKISKHNIAGIITTNYDEFFESIFDGYKTFVGQDELVFSQLQGVAEIYKIHGSVSNARSIVINSEDYKEFKEKRKYLAAKLMTIFMEYPIVFLGYSITDSNIRTILSDIVQCLPEERIPLMKKRFVFVEYVHNQKNVVVSSHSIVFGNRIVEMTKITLSNFGLLFDALSKKKAAFPVKVLRRFKDELYNFVLTSEPSETMRVAPLEDGRIDEETLAITIGLSSTGTYGLARAVDSEKWYRNIILHDLPYTNDELLKHVYEELARQNSRKLPVWYYLEHACGDYQKIRDKAPCTYGDIVSKDSIGRNKSAIASRSMQELWDQEKENEQKAIRLLGYMPEESMDVNVLENILREIFERTPNCLGAEEFSNNYKSNIRRLIRIYDFLKYAK